MRIHCIIHAAFEKLGAIESWALEKGHAISETHVYKGESLPRSDQFDFLVVMGGPQSPLRLDKWPYLQNEMDLIKKSIFENKAILGICLGAQLIAQSLGAKVERSPHKEVGVFPVQLLPDAAEDPVFSQFETTFPVMHWHNDMPGRLENARLLAKSEGCPLQAFSIGDRIYGLQFHMEMTHANVKEMLMHCESDLTNDLYVESKSQLLNRNFEDINAKMFTVLDYLSSTV